MSLTLLDLEYVVKNKLEIKYDPNYLFIKLKYMQNIEIDEKRFYEIKGKITKIEKDPYFDWMYNIYTDQKILDNSINFEGKDWVFGYNCYILADSIWNAVCPKCNSPAYKGFLKFECSNCKW